MRGAVAHIVGGLCIAIFAALVLDVLWGVATRYILGQQSHWTEELARVLLVWLAMLGAALAYMERSHLGIDVLTRLLDPEARRIADIITHSFVFLFAAAVLVYGGMELFLDRWESGQVMSALPIRKAWFYLSLPVSGLLIALVSVDLLVQVLFPRKSSGSSET
jgi:TRAP-type C4-dicarboxylate transport system permease small subunit